MPKLLLVEDETDLREAMAEEIAEEGYEIKVAQNGKTALELLANYTPDIIVSDISMPEMDGFELLENIRSSHNQLDDVPFVFLSAFNAKDDIIKGKKLGADDYLVKPVDFDLLFATLESRLGQVQRMVDRKEKQFVKLYHTLQSELQKKSQSESASDQQKDPDRVRVYGRCLNFESLISIFNRFNHNKNLNLCGFIQSILETTIPAEVQLDASVPGMIFMYGADPARKFRMPDNLYLDQAIQKKLFEHDIGLTITSNFGQLVLGKDLRIRDVPFDTHLPPEVVLDDREKTKALLQKLRTKFGDKEFLQEKTKQVREQCSIYEAAFNDNGKKTPAMRFFHYDELSENYLQTAIAFCGIGNQKILEFLRDMSFLELVPQKLATENREAIVIVDVHYDTISKPEKMVQYRKKYESVFNDLGSRIYLNVRGIPHNIDLSMCASTVKTCKLKKSGWIAQFNPWLDTGLEVEQLGVPFVVWSFNDVYGTQASLDHYRKLRSAYKLCGSALILRDIPPGINLSDFRQFDFDGYSVNKA